MMMKISLTEMLKLKRSLAVFILIVLSMMSHSAFAATYYVDSAAANDSGSGSVGSPKKTISSGLGLMSNSGGDTLVIKNGTYVEDVNDLVSGGVGNYNIVKAENDGGVVIQGKLYVDAGEQYIQIEGLKFIYTGTGFGSGIDNADHIKIMRTAFEGGPLQGNDYTFGIGGSYILIEDCWMYGPGGRQNLIIYEASEVVIRRVVLRHDHGWSNVQKTDPEGVGTVYNSSNVSIQNVIVLDSNQNVSNVGSEWVGAFTHANNQGNGTMRNNKISGTIVLNVDGNAFEHGGTGDMFNIQYEDVVVWWNAASSNAGGAVSMNNPSTKIVTAQRMTIGNAYAAATLWDGINSSINLKNSIIYGISGFPIGTPDAGDGVITDSYNNCFNNQNENCSATGKVSSDPTGNGLLYPPRIEDGASLLTAGEGGGRIGAIITNQIGTSGTLWNETGFDTVSTTALWPWPYEDRIRTDMRSVTNGARGFAANGQTLTNYIWSALGNSTPGDITGTALPIPQNITIIKQ